jgi:hypothetical protein
MPVFGAFVALLRDGTAVPRPSRPPVGGSPQLRQRLSRASLDGDACVPDHPRTAQDLRIFNDQCSALIEFCRIIRSDALTPSEWGQDTLRPKSPS